MIALVFHRGGMLLLLPRDMVREHGLKGNLMPPKTSGHRVCFEVPEVRVPLEVLRG